MDCFPDDILCEQQFLEQAVGDFVPGPAEVRAPVQHRRDKKRFTEVLHNFCHEPLPWYKNLEHIRPQFPTAMRKWTEREGFRVSDHHNIEVTTRDQAQRTKKGSLRTSSGMVTYNAINRMHFELDAESLAKILREQEPHQTGKNGIRSGAGAGSSGKMWNVKNLEKAYQTQFRRNGSWTRQGVTFKVFLALFPKTFELFGADHSFVRIINKSSVCVIDCSEDAMVSLALACEKGYVERITPLDGTMKAGQDPLQLPQLGHVRSPHSVGSLAEWTHPKTLEHFGVHSDATGLEPYKGKNNCNGAIVGFSKDSPAYHKVLVPWVNCAYNRNCIAPPGSNRSNHRQDQAALTVLAHQNGYTCYPTCKKGCHGITLHIDGMGWAKNVCNLLGIPNPHGKKKGQRW